MRKISILFAIILFTSCVSEQESAKFQSIISGMMVYKDTANYTFSKPHYFVVSEKLIYSKDREVGEYTVREYYETANTFTLINGGYGIEWDKKKYFVSRIL